MPMIGDVVKYEKEVIRTCKCWRCKYRGEYEWRTPRYGEKIQNSKKTFCHKTKRWGDPKRAYFCKKFESNSDSYTDPYTLSSEAAKQSE